MVPDPTSDRPAPSARRRPGAGTRRRVLGATGAAAPTALAGCSDSLSGTEESPEYSLAIERIDESPVEYARYEPSEGVKGADERELPSAILPDGRHTTYGYRPVPDEAYVDREGTYYGVEYAVTGRRRVERPLVRLDPVAEADVPEDAAAIDDLDGPGRSILGLLSLHADDTGGFSADELRGDARVLRRSKELDSRLAPADLPADVRRLPTRPSPPGRTRRRPRRRTGSTNCSPHSASGTSTPP